MEKEFAKIGSYQYTSEAIIIKGKLESEGIEVFMADNFTIDTDPLVSNAIGGVKLYVRSEDMDKATAVLSEISRYSVDDKGQAVICPKCNSNKVEVGTTVKEGKSLFAFLFGFLIAGGMPVYTKYTYRCSNCNNEFEIK
ncbi:MAG: hypothetical protein DI539_19305 [Flavobacterium psychrophilum]|nr:MAG: hypothetical protein DI539_19305 [Flavobacterium psychrophilum]